MKKILLPVLFIGLMLATSAWAQTNTKQQVITLSDGSELRGQVVKLEDGIYSIQTKNLGLVYVNQADVKVIAVADADKGQSSAPNTFKTSGTTSQQLKNMVQQKQMEVMTNPQLMGEIKSLMNDPQIMKMMNDPNFVNDILSYDPQRIQSNPKVQELFNNPQIQHLINEFQQSSP